METGFKRNLLAELLDSAGRGVVLMALGIGWFVFLWGLNLPALLAIRYPHSAVCSSQMP